LRWEKELAVHAAKIEKDAETRQKKVSLEIEEAELEARLKAIQLELQAKRAQKKILAHAGKSRDAEGVREQAHLNVLRGAVES
jgi:circadian clock protein KaiC